jgi:hypothetical protein
MIPAGVKIKGWRNLIVGQISSNPFSIFFGGEKSMKSIQISG